MILTICFCAIVMMGNCFGAENRLPGPFSIPLIGNLLQIGTHPHISFTQWAQRFGPIYRLQFGLKEAIVLTDHKLIRELFEVTTALGRFENHPAMVEFTKGPFGEIDSNELPWEVQRKLAVRAIQNFHFAKSSREAMILDEVDNMMDSLREQKSSPVSGNRLFNSHMIGSVWRTLSGEKLTLEKESRSEFVQQFDNLYTAVLFTQVMGETTGYFYSPAIRFLAPRIFGWDRYKGSLNTIMKAFQKTASMNEETVDIEAQLGDGKDLQDLHSDFQTGNKTDSKGNRSFAKDIEDANISAGLFSLFLAGTEPPILTLTWALLYLSENQNVQKKLQSEIDQVLGSRLPSLSDRVNMPYTEAVLSEVLRIAPAVPSGVPHEMKSDLDFHGYRFPKGASILANIYGVHHDPKVWGDPENFRPERFLNEDQTKYVPHEALIPYDEGQRSCYGGPFADDALFLFVTRLFQQFNIRPEYGPEGKANFVSEMWLLLRPKPFKVVATPRN